jgi:hypothetical protein
MNFCKGTPDGQSGQEIEHLPSKGEVLSSNPRSDCCDNRSTWWEPGELGSGLRCAAEQLMVLDESLNLSEPQLAHVWKMTAWVTLQDISSKSSFTWLHTVQMSDTDPQSSYSIEKEVDGKPQETRLTQHKSRQRPKEK